MFRNLNLNNLENVLKRNQRAGRSWEYTFRAFEGTILKMYPLGGDHSDAFVNSIHVPVCPKKLWIRH